MKQRKWIALTLSVSLLVAALTGCGGQKELLDPQDPVEIEVWHYYNGNQQKVFDDMVEEFNETTGKEKGIVVQSSSMGSVDDLQFQVVAAINGDVGAREVPNIFASYSDVAYGADQMDIVVDLRDYLTEQEVASYVEGYIEEGDFSGDGEIKIMPIAKSTEVMVLNQTDWEPFAAATGATLDDLATIEGVTATAQRYYEWTDAQTPAVAEDGKAFFGRDSMANYILVGAMQLGTEILATENGSLALQFDETVIRSIWDNYYIPFIKGYFTAVSHFRSDDLKTGSILSCVGSSAGAAYYPDEVSTSDTESHPIEITVLPAPQFEGGESYAVQQGAGMVVTKGTEQEICASVEFLKWFTSTNNSIRFAVQSGYLPVTVEANTTDAIFNSGLEVGSNVEKSLAVSIETVNSNYMYTTKPFTVKSNTVTTAVRDYLESALSERAAADRAVVVERIASGMSMAEATRDFCSDAVFQSWYETAKETLGQW